MNTVWRRLALLCLVLAASDPLLRHWEAASDLVRSLAELRSGDSHSTIEPTDDGIADDPGTALLRADDGVSATDRLIDGGATLAPLPSLLTLVGTPAGLLEVRSRRDRPPRLLVGSSLRLAWLQRYLI